MSCSFPLCDATEDSHAPFFHPLLVLCSTSRPAKADVPQRATLFQNDGLLFETPCCASKWLGWSAPVIPDSVLFANPVCEQAGLPQFSGFSILARFSFFLFPFHQFLARSEKTPSRLGAPSCCWRTISNFCENHHRCFFLFSKFQFNQLCCCPSVSPVSFTPSQP